jgi:hypothetical protein
MSQFIVSACSRRRDGGGPCADRLGSVLERGCPLTGRSVGSWCGGDDDAFNPTCTEPPAGVATGWRRRAGNSDLMGLNLLRLL